MSVHKFANIIAIGMLLAIALIKAVDGFVESGLGIPATLSAIIIIFFSNYFYERKEHENQT